jgi:phytoene synthase
MEPAPSFPKPLHLPKGSVPRSRSNLAAGLLLLPSVTRKDAFLFHDFCRHVDDIADDPALSENDKQQSLNAWLHALHPAHAAELPPAFREMIDRRRLDRHLLSEIVRGMLMDTERNRYSSFDDLRLYCQRVASDVGLVSASIFGAKGAAVERYAKELGIALQLTNILRDVAEDAAMKRIYIPMEDLERFGVSEEEILEGAHTPPMTHLLNHQAERADSHFAKAELAWSEMSVNQRRLMRPARFMSAIYRELLLQMHLDRYDVFAKRYRVPGFRKLLIQLRVMTSGN